MSKSFHIGDIISITTGILVSPERMGGVCKILNYMTRDELFTHQLTRASKQCAPYLLAQYPYLSEENLKTQLDELSVSLKGVSTKYKSMAAVGDWLNLLPKQVPALAVLDGLSFDEMMLPVNRLPLGDYDQKDPIAELEETAGKKHVIVVKAPEEGDTNAD